MKNLLLAILVGLPLLGGTAARAGGEQCAAEARQAKEAKLASRGWLGVDLEKGTNGRVTVADVKAGGPAALAGVLVGDVVEAYGGVWLTADLDAKHKKALHAAKAAQTVGEPLTLTLERHGERLEVALVPVEVPEAVLAEWLADDEAPAGEQIADLD